MAEKGWLERLERGKYMIVPLEVGPDRRWTEDAYVLTTYLVDPSATAYWSALHYWNLTEQVPQPVSPSAALAVDLLEPSGRAATS